MDDTEFLPNSYDIGDVTGAATIVHLNPELQMITIRQASKYGSGDGVTLDIPALTALMTILKERIDHTGINGTNHGLN